MPHARTYEYSVPLSFKKHGSCKPYEVAALQGLNGAGLYFAQESCKAWGYAKKKGNERCILLCRVALGDPHYQYLA